MWWTSDRQAFAVNYLMHAGGLSPIGAAGLVSRWANIESSGGPASVNPSSGAFGIAQWLGARLSPIRGNTSFEAQLAYVVRELNGAESRAGAILRSATNADQAAVGASTYERAEGYNSATGRDNYTSRTASGVASVLANVGGGSASPFGSGVLTAGVDGIQGDDYPINSTVGGTAVGAIAISLVAVVFAYVLLSD
jgi:tail lysozyme